MSPLAGWISGLTGADFRRNPLSYLRSIDDGSPVLRFRAGLSSFYVVNDPEAIHRVLVADADRYGEGKWTLRGKRVMGDCLITREGEAHHRRRQLIQPAFERRQLEPKMGAITGRAAALAEGWREGQEVEMRVAMAELALAAASDVLFSVQLDRASGRLVPALMSMLGEIPRPGPPLRSGRPLRRARRVVDGIVPDAVAAADGELAGRHADLLDRLRAGDDREPALGDRELADELVSLLIASIDTTPGTLAWCWYLLATNPAHERRLTEELAEALGGREPSPADLKRLPILDRTLSEVLRLYPPVHFIDRRPLKDVEVAGTAIPAGAYMLLSPLLTQRDPRHFPDPDRFDPDRWLEPSERPRYSYFPFGGGPHTCIGMALARMQLALVVATIAQRWRPRPADSFPAGPTPNQGRFPMVLESRD